MIQLESLSPSLFQKPWVSFFLICLETFNLDFVFQTYVSCPRVREAVMILDALRTFLGLVQLAIKLIY